MNKSLTADGTIDGFNNSAAFLGWSSSAPIYSIELSGLNIGWDNLRFTPVSQSPTGVPEPSTVLGASVALGFEEVIRRLKRKKAA